MLLPLVAMQVADCLAWAVPSLLGLCLPLWLGLRRASLGCALLAWLHQLHSLHFVALCAALSGACPILGCHNISGFHSPTLRRAYTPAGGTSVPISVVVIIMYTGSMLFQLPHHIQWRMPDSVMPHKTSRAWLPFFYFTEGVHPRRRCPGTRLISSHYLI